MGDDRHRLDGNPLDQDYRITHTGPRRGEQPFLGYLPNEHADNDGPIQPMGDFGMPSYQVNAQRVRGTTQLPKDLLHHARRCAALGEQQGVQHPKWRGAAGSHIVGVDMHGIPADLVRGKGDRVGLDDHIGATHIDDGHIFAHARTCDQPLMLNTPAPQEVIEEVERKLARGEYPIHCCTSFHMRRRAEVRLPRRAVSVA